MADSSSTPTHATAHCAGTWRLAGTGRQRWIRCASCAAEHAATPENRRAAIDENRAGLVLHRLASEGNARLDSETGR